MGSGLTPHLLDWRPLVEVHLVAGVVMELGYPIEPVRPLDPFAFGAPTISIPLEDSSSLSGFDLRRLLV